MLKQRKTSRQIPHSQIWKAREREVIVDHVDRVYEKDDFVWFPIQCHDILSKENDSQGPKEKVNSKQYVIICKTFTYLLCADLDHIALS